MVERNKPSFTELEQGLLIDEYALDEALANQPDLFYRVGKQLEDLISLRDGAQSKLDDVAARVSINIRSRARKRDEKITEGEINARVRLDEQYQEAAKEHADLKAECGRYARLEKSFEQRSRALGKLVDLYTAGYFGDVTHRKQVGTLKDHKATDIRQRMNDLRQQRNK
jgi:hypothetical protein